MKNYALLMIAISMMLISTKGFSQKIPDVQKKTADSAVIYFPITDYDYGILIKGEDGTSRYSFENSGNIPLIISDVHAACGCTTPTWPHQPIMPGKSGEIRIVYDTERLGEFMKTVTIYSNAKAITLQLSGLVQEPGKE